VILLNLNTFGIVEFHIYTINNIEIINDIIGAENNKNASKLFLYVLIGMIQYVDIKYKIILLNSILYYQCRMQYIFMVIKTSMVL